MAICSSKEKDTEKVLQDLKKELSGKRCLIVLDDVWNQDVNKWEKLKTCLQHAGTGSAILTTTRDAKVAQIMSGVEVEAHNLRILDDVYLKEILQRRAFILQKPEFGELEDIVDQILNKCAGSPLAAKAIGSMLSSKTSKDEWMAVLKKSSICNQETGILPILKLSYDNLPLQMKQCFAFCAVFPKDYVIDVENLIHLWMANDYVPLEEDVPLETTGRRIFDGLAWRSFFEDAKQTSLVDKSWSEFCSIKICKIHDLMHDMALSVLREECATITRLGDQKKLVSKHSRHMFLSYPATITNMTDSVKKQAPTFQTFLCLDVGIWTPHVPKYNSLRALKLCYCREFQIRPRHLQHLRYLDLSYNSWLKELPKEISIMYNLQTLNVSDCYQLCRLPRDMKYMGSLRHLYTQGCISLKGMPPDLRGLSCLQILTYFVASASSDHSNIAEFQNLDLCGSLMLSYMENVTEVQAKAAALGKKEKLRRLSLEWSRTCHEEPVRDGHKKVLEALNPHDGLEFLEIIRYKSTCLPAWMKDLSLLHKHLTELHLIGFTMCEEFPQFSHLEALQILRLEELDKLQSLCSDEASSTFLKLKKLELYNLKSMERWVAPLGRGGDVTLFPLLENLVIHGCPKLSTLPETPNLKVAKLDEDKAQLSLLILRCRYLSLLSELKLSVRDKEAALEVDDENNIESPLLALSLCGCNFFFLSSPAQPAVGICRWFGKLVSLGIHGCDALIHWPEDVFQSLVSLKHLLVSKCQNLVGTAHVKGEASPTRTLILPHLNSLHVHDCEMLVELFVLPPFITEMNIKWCKILKFTWVEAESKSLHVEQLDDLSTLLENCPSTNVPKQWAARTNHRLLCLESLYIDVCDSLVTLPHLPPVLKRLSIWCCPNLCSVSGQLDALEILQISACNQLRSLDMGHLPSLVRLDLVQCDRLTSLPGVLGSYSALQYLHVRYCSAIEMKPVYERHQQRLDSLAERDLSRARDSYGGPKLKDPKSWKYACYS